MKSPLLVALMFCFFQSIQGVGLPDSCFVRQKKFLLKNDSLIETDLSLTENVQGDFFDRHLKVSAQLVIISQKPFIATKNNFEKDPNAPDLWKEESMVLFNLPLQINLWKNASMNITPEFTGGNAVGGSAGLGGYVNGVYGLSGPTPYIFKAQFSQKIQMKNEKAFLKNIGITLGRVYIQELFDYSVYSGDPNNDFLNFNHIMHSAWDASSTVYGYTHGAALKFSADKLQLNFAAVTVNRKASSAITDWNVKNAHSFNLQLVRRFNVAGEKGSLRFLGFSNRSFCGKYSDFLIDTVTSSAYLPESLKAYRYKNGVAVDLDFSLGNNSGMFARFCLNDGKTETMHFTEADQSFNIGLIHNPRIIKRSEDMIGVSVSMNSLSTGHTEFQRRRGSGFMLRSENFTYGNETAFEFFYRLNIIKNANITFNYQYIVNSGYNRNNGNSDFLACRINFTF